jgi:hypothetical protein
MLYNAAQCCSMLNNEKQKKEQAQRAQVKLGSQAQAQKREVPPTSPPNRTKFRF